MFGMTSFGETTLKMNGKPIGRVESVNFNVEPECSEAQECTYAQAPAEGTIRLGSIQQLSRHFITKFLPNFDLAVTTYPPRNGRYQTKRLRKKWAKLHGTTTIYTGCKITAQV